MSERLITLYCRRPFFCGAALLLVLVLLVYGDALFWPEYRVISRAGDDLAKGIPGLDFIFGEWRRGNFVLWCPYLLGGYSVFGAFQSLQLYPPSLLFLLFPSGPACNLFIMLHVWLMGVGMMWWLLRRDLHPLAATVSGAVLMLGTTTTMQIFAGHITPLAAMTWMPFILVALDGLLQPETSRREKARWVLAGTLFVALQIGANFPQHVVYTALAAGLYFLARVLTARQWNWAQRVGALGAASLMYVWGALLLAVQLLTSWHASKETGRAAAMDYSFVATYSFPPENLLTLLAPTFFGDDARLSYWGRWSFEEMTFFFGVATLLLAVWGLWRSTLKERWLWLGLGGLFLLIGLGRYTPLHFWFYQHVPMFGSFRASSRALFEASVFLCALAGLGLDQLLRARVENKEGVLRQRFSFVLLGLTVAMAVLAFWLLGAGASPVWKSWMQWIGNSGQTLVKPPTYQDTEAVASMAKLAGLSLLVAATVCLTTAFLFRQTARARPAVYVLAVLAVLEIAGFARWVRPDFDLRDFSQPEVEEFLAAHPGDYRFIKDNFPNLALRWNAHNMSGYESFRLRRYDEFIHWTQGRSPDATAAILRIEKYHPLYAMLRCRYIFSGANPQPVIAPKEPLPRVLLVPNYEVHANRDEIFEALEKPDFDPRQTVILESEPSPRPAGSTPVSGTARVVEASTDHLVIEANTAQPAILLVTDSYSRDWKARPLDGSVQQEYSVLPGNYVLRAIPLQAGRHKLKMEYSPSLFHTGKWISLAALLIYLLSLAMAFLKPRQAKGNRPTLI